MCKLVPANMPNGFLRGFFSSLTIGYGVSYGQRKDRNQKELMALCVNNKLFLSSQYIPVPVFILK
jgi:hypothetical protein